jgi:hypothetical protein
VFLLANFVVIALIGGFYYWYTRSKNRKVSIKESIDAAVNGKK